MLNFLMKCWGIAEQPAFDTANPAISDIGARPAQTRANSATPAAPRTNDSPQRRGSMLEGSARGSSSYQLPEELRKRTSSSAPSRRGSIYGPRQTHFTQIEGVDYEKLDEVMANDSSMAQLIAVSTAQVCSENLDFLATVKVMRANGSAASNWVKFKETVDTWVINEAPSQINLDAHTQAGLCAALSAGQEYAATRSGKENIDALLSDAEAKVRRLLQGGPLKVLRDALVEAPPRS